MEQKHVAIIMITVTVLLAATLLTSKPFINNTHPTATVYQTSYHITIADGIITKIHMILTVAGNGITTNGEIIVATAKNRTAYYTMYIYSNNTLHTMTMTMKMNPAPKEFIITYNDRYLTYNGISYYTQINPPITFSSLTTATYSGTTIIEVSQAIVSWASTIT